MPKAQKHAEHRKGTHFPPSVALSTATACMIGPPNGRHHTTIQLMQSFVHPHISSVHFPPSETNGGVDISSVRFPPFETNGAVDIFIL